MERLRARVRRMKLHNLVFHGRVSKEEMSRQLLASDVGLNAYGPGAPHSITNKLFDYGAAGLAVVNSVPGEVAELVRREAMGLNYPAGDPRGLADRLTELAADRQAGVRMGERARSFVQREGDHGTTYPRAVAFLEGLAAGGCCGR